MKNNLIYMLLICTGAGCSNSETDIASPIEKEIEIPAPGFVDLSAFGFPVGMDIGPQSASDFQFQWNDAFGRLEIKNGQGIDFFVIQDTVSCVSKKRDIESGIFTVTYVVDNDEILFYEATLPFTMSSYYHFFACIQIDGKIYNFENNPLVEFRKSDIAGMVELSRSFKAVHIEKI